MSQVVDYENKNLERIKNYDEKFLNNLIFLLIYFLLLLNLS